MKKGSIILFTAILAFFSSSCDSTNTKEVEKEKKTEVTTDDTSGDKKTDAPAKTAAQILVEGSWNNPDAARSEDVIFNADGTMLWRSGNDEGQDKWEVKGTDILFFYGKDYKIEELTASKLVVSEGGDKTTYERNTEETSSTAACQPKFKVEGINDAKGLYTNGNESWTIHFAEDDFIAFYTKDGKQDDAETVEQIERISDCEYNVSMKGIQGETVPRWVLKYNESKKYYDLYVHSYDAETDTWADKIYRGSADNG